MVPAYLEQLPVIPVLPDGKADRKNLPRPASSGRLGADQSDVVLATPSEKASPGRWRSSWGSNGSRWTASSSTTWA